MKNLVISSFALAIFVSLFSGYSQAGINLENTRVVLVEPRKEASLMIKNSGSEAVMFQAWIEAADKSEDLPFAITPVLKVLSSRQKQALRILYIGRGLPTEKESMFWVNVREVPQKAREENSLQIAVQQRLKLFYRPAGLAGKVTKAPQQLKWRLLAKDGKNYLKVINTSPFYLSFASLVLRMENKSFIVPIDMISPFATSLAEIPELPSGIQAKNLHVDFEIIDDASGISKYQGTLSG